jgi:hypothetical protein
MQIRRAVVLAPADTTGGLEVLVDEVVALLVVVDNLDAVALAEAFADDLGWSAYRSLESKSSSGLS